MERTPDVLLVDDDADQRYLVSKYLNASGIPQDKVHQSSNANDALTLVRRRTDPFDVVITDMHMPDIQGHVLASMIRNIHRDTVIILYSAYSNQIQLMREHGVDVLLQKDFSERMFVDLLRYVRKSVECHEQEPPARSLGGAEFC